MAYLPIVHGWFKVLWRRTLSAVWLRPPDSVRFRAPAARRPGVNRQLHRARSLLGDARARSAGESRNILGASALQTLLGVLAGSEEDVSIPAAGAVRRGLALVATKLDRATLTDTLAGFGDPERRPPHDGLGFQGLVELYDWTESLIDARSEREVRVRRFLPWGVAVVALGAAAYGWLRDENLALGMNVTASSICQFTPASPPGKDRLGRLVDGVRVEAGIASKEWAHGTFAMCTEIQVHPWITVDLGAERSISQIVVYNRADCCWGTDDTPVVAQLSVDNSRFVTIATRADPFTEDFPWRVSLPHGRARYVRLFNPSDTPKNMVFGEIEIYGH